MKYILFIFLFCTLIHSCNNNKQPEKFEIFYGNYNIEGVHKYGIIQEYDAPGNIIFEGYYTNEYSEMLEIKQLHNTDTLLILGLMNSFEEEERIEVKGYFDSDTIRIVHEFNEHPVYNNYIRGNIWLQQDNIFLNYKWDKSDIWSNLALPRRGEVFGMGKRK